MSSLFITPGCQINTEIILATVGNGKVGWDRRDGDGVLCNEGLGESQIQQACDFQTPL